MQSEAKLLLDLDRRCVGPVSPDPGIYVTNVAPVCRSLPLDFSPAPPSP